MSEYKKFTPAPKVHNVAIRRRASWQSHGHYTRDFIGQVMGACIPPTPEARSRSPRRIGAIQDRGRDWLRAARPSSSPGRLCASSTTASTLARPLNVHALLGSPHHHAGSPSLACARLLSPTSTVPAVLVFSAFPHALGEARAFSRNLHHALGLISVASPSLPLSCLGEGSARSQKCVV